MTTRPLFRDAYLREAKGMVRAHTDEGGIVLDESLFYPTGGGQPGDSGRIVWEGGAAGIATAVKGDGGTIVLVPDAPVSLPAPGTVLRQTLDWDRRYRHMRMHTALHLLSVVVPLPVTGGQVGAERGRLDFDMPDPPGDAAALEQALGHYELAAGAGIAEAALRLAELYRSGRAGSIDRVRALAWYLLAERLGASEAGVLAADLAETMTEAQRESARELAELL